MITPKPGFKVDPNNPNGVIPDTSYIPPGMPGADPTPSVSTPPVVMTPPDKTTATVTATPVVSPEDQKLINMGLTPEQVTAINSPNGIDPSSFSSVVSNVEAKLKTNNDLVTTRGYLMKHLFDAPLTPDEISKLPPDVQSVVNSGNKDDIELQMRLINDQISGRAQTLSSSITALTTGYDKSQADTKNAVASILSYAQSTGKPIDQVAKALAPIYGLRLTTQMVDNLNTLGVAVKPVATTVTTTTGNLDVNIPSGTIASQTNNPLNIKYSSTSPAGGSDSGIAGKDGGTFASFNSPQEGLQAAVNLLKSPVYSGLTVDQAMKKWSNSGYGAEVSPTINGSQLISSLSPEQLNQLVSDMAKRESGANISPTGVSATPPDPKTGNVMDPVTHVSPNAIYQAAMDYAFTQKMPSLGLGSGTAVATTRGKILSTAGAIASALNTTFPQMQALYKANASAAKQNVERLARVESVAGTVASQFPRLAQMADQIKADGIDLTENDIQSGATTVLRKTGNVNASNYVELLSTIRGDYSAMIAALGGSRGGQFFAANAIDAIPIGYTGDQYLGLKDTIEKSATNATQAINGEVSNLIGISGGLPGAGGSSANSKGGSYDDYLKAIGQ